MPKLKELQKAGDSRHLQPSDYEKIKLFSATGVPLRLIASHLKITEQWFHKLRKKDKKIDKALLQGKAKLHDKLHGRLIQKATEGDGDTELCKWLLQRHFEEYNINAQRHASSTVDNRTVNLIQIPDSLTPNQYGDLLQSLNAPALLEHEDE
jgi:hypothetical protein